MNISKVLLDRAILDIWGNPSEDNRVVIKATRLSKDQGNYQYVEIDLLYYHLPNNTRCFDLFELGKLDIKQLGLPNECYDRWISLTSLINTYQISLKIISNKKIVSLTNGYIKSHPDGNILIALDHSINSGLDIISNDLYLQFYTCIYYRTDNKVLSNKLSYTTYVHDTSNSDTIYDTFINIYEAITTNKTLFFNGVLYNGTFPSYFNLKQNDTFIYYKDPLISIEYSTLLSNLTTYTSTLDSCDKYILSIEQDDLFFIDDIDFYLTIDKNGITYGLYIPKIDNSYFRMLTYKEFSINKFIVDEYTTLLGTILNISDFSNLKILVKFRDNKVYKGNFQDDDKLHFLMKFPQDIRLRVINGDLSNLVSFWNANYLETAKLNLWISKYSTYVLTESNLQYLYSFNSAIKTLERLYQKRNESIWRLPPLISNYSGDLVNFTDGNKDIGIYLNHQNLNDNPITSTFGYEFVLPFISSEKPIDILVEPNTFTTTIDEVDIGLLCYYYDVTNGLTLLNKDIDYTIEKTNINTIITWLDLNIYRTRYVRLANRGILIKQTILLENIHIPIDLYNGRLGLDAYYDIGFGYIYVWCNGKYLIEGLDYVVVDGKFRLLKIIRGVTTFNFDIIYTGLPDESLTHEIKGSWGWVINGKIGCNYQYDLYNDLNKLYFVDGLIKDISELYTEEPYGLSGSIIPHPNGVPYAIVPYPKFIDTRELLTLVHTESNELTKNNSIKALLAEVYPIIPDESLMVITNKYLVSSLLMDKLIDDIKDGTLIITQSDYTLNEINTVLTSYQEYLTKDVANYDHDMRFLEIHPRLTQDVTSVNLNSYNFLNKVNELKLGGRVSAFNLYLNILY